jgi:hypothetical protein
LYFRDRVRFTFGFRSRATPTKSSSSHGTWDDIASEEALLEILRMDGPFAMVCTSRAKLSGLTRFRPLHRARPATRPGRSRARQGRQWVGSLRRWTGVGARRGLCWASPRPACGGSASGARRPKASLDQFLAEITSPERGVRALRAGQTALEPVLESSFASLGPDALSEA